MTLLYTRAIKLVRLLHMQAIFSVLVCHHIDGVVLAVHSQQHWRDYKHARSEQLNSKGVAYGSYWKGRGGRCTPALQTRPSSPTPSSSSAPTTVAPASLTLSKLSRSHVTDVIRLSLGAALVRLCSAASARSDDLFSTTTCAPFARRAFAAQNPVPASRLVQRVCIKACASLAALWWS